MESKDKTNIRKLLRENIQQLTPYQVIPETPAVKLDANENNWLAGWFQDELAKKIKEIPLHQYPDTDCRELRKKLAELNEVEHQQVLTGVGSDQIISWIIQAFVEPGDGVVTMNPTFGMYAIDTLMADGALLEVSLDQNFQFQPESFLTMIHEEGPKVVFITNPNNPTGGIIPRHVLEKVLLAIPAETVVVLDEAYYEFYGETLADQIMAYPNLIVLRTLSKAYGLAGVRVGYALASDEMIDAISCVKPPYHMSSLDQAAALACLEMIPKVKEELVNVIRWRENMKNFLIQLKNNGRDSQLEVFPSAANFLLIRTPHAEKLNHWLKEHRISVRGYGTEGILANCLRITIGTAEENVMLQETIEEYYK